MIVDESAALRATLDRRLGIDRLLAIDPLRALVDPADPPGPRDRPARDPAPLAREQAATTLWSSDALRLQMLARTGALASPEGGPVRFDVPLLLIEPRPNDAKASVPAVPSSSAEARPAPPASDQTAARPTPSSNVRQPPESNGLPPAFVPLVLQGPAWIGQPMELIVRRERADESLDNAALDRWCGEVVIDLPELGRVAGHLEFSVQGLRVRLAVENEASVASLAAAAGELAAAFARNDLRVSALSIGRPAADAMRPLVPLSSSAALSRVDRGVA